MPVPQVPGAVPLPRYLDTGSSEPLHPAAAEVLGDALARGYADPLRLHRPARDSRLLLENARAVVASCLGVRDDEVTFTSSGTAAVHLGVLGLLRGRERVSRLLALSAVEHSAVFAAGRWWQAYAEGGWTSLPVDRHGRLDLVTADLAGDLAAGVVGVLALQQANPEVGTLQPVDEAAARFPEVPLFLDACATGARLPLPASWSAAALSAHKWGGPAGVGVLLVRKGARWRPPFPTDDRSDARVSGFENVPAALAAAAALRARVSERDALAEHACRLADRLRAGLRALEDVELHGHPTERLPHLVSFSCLYVDGEALVVELDRRGFALASGSACTASSLEPSHVLVAMGALTHGNVRVTFGSGTTETDVDELLGALRTVLPELRSRVGA
jgi:cysteine desulfurase